jgi:hypothetical protein
MDDNEKAAINLHKELIETLYQLKAGQSILAEGQAGINNTLKEVNTSIDKLFRRSDAHTDQIKDNTQAMKIHILECPQKEKIEEMNMKLISGNYPAPAALKEQVTKLEVLLTKVQTERETEAKKHNKWIDILLIPVVKWASLGLVAYIVLVLISHLKEMPIK